VIPRKSLIYLRFTRVFNDAVTTPKAFREIPHFKQPDSRFGGRQAAQSVADGSSSGTAGEFA
jgi:hypothetical protein